MQEMQETQVQSLGWEDPLEKGMATHSSILAWKMPWAEEPAAAAAAAAKSLQSCPTLCDPMDCTALQAPLSMGFSGQEYWSGLPCPPPGDLPNPGIEPRSPALQVDYLPSKPQGQQKAIKES